MMNADETTRFDLLEIDGVETPAAAIPDPAAIIENVAIVENVATDPIEAFRQRMERERAERLAEDRAAMERAEKRAAELAARRAAISPSAFVAVERADETTGAVAFWQLAGSVDLPTLRAAMVAEGVPEDFSPVGCSAEVALSRAVKSLQDRSILVRKHPLGGWALVHESAADQQLSYAEGARFDLENGVVTVFNLSSPTEEILAEDVRGAFAANLRALSTTDVSAWLVKLAEGKFSGVALRDRGGVYFVPKDKVEIFQRVKRALAACSQNVVHEIPALKSAEAVAAVLDAVCREADRTIIDLEGELNDPEGVGTRAATNRVREIDAMLEKIRGYGKLLGPRAADAILTQIDKIEEIKKGFEKVTTNFANLEVD